MPHKPPPPRLRNGASHQPFWAQDLICPKKSNWFLRSQRQTAGCRGGSRPCLRRHWPMFVRFPENFSARGQMGAAFGLDYTEVLAPTRPRLIYCANISG